MARKKGTGKRSEPSLFSRLVDKNCINLIFGYTPIKYASRYYQLKVGFGAMGTVLAKIAGWKHPSAGGARNLYNLLSICTPNAADGKKSEEN